MNKPECVKDDHIEYLDALRNSGVTNMFGATPYLRKADPELTRQQASQILIYWMNTYEQRHPADSE